MFVGVCVKSLHFYGKTQTLEVNYHQPFKVEFLSVKSDCFDGENPPLVVEITTSEGVQTLELGDIADKIPDMIKNIVACFELFKDFFDDIPDITVTYNTISSM